MSKLFVFLEEFEGFDFRKALNVQGFWSFCLIVGGEIVFQLYVRLDKYEGFVFRKALNFQGFWSSLIIVYGPILSKLYAFLEDDKGVAGGINSPTMFCNVFIQNEYVAGLSNAADVPIYTPSSGGFTYLMMSLTSISAYLLKKSQLCM